jgi:membrane-associated phospholipid phosphatase
MSSSTPRAKRRLNPIERADLAVATTVALDGRTKAARRIGAVADLGDQPPMRLLSALAIVAGAVGRDPKLVRTGLRMLAAHGVATAVKSLIKGRIDRTRPGDAMEKGRYRLDRGRSSQKRLTSMPSGHSAGVTAVAAAIAREYPGVAPASGLAAAAIVAAQLPAKNHYLSDVVVGTAIGLAAEAAVSAAMRVAGGRD